MRELITEKAVAASLLEFICSMSIRSERSGFTPSRSVGVRAGHRAGWYEATSTPIGTAAAFMSKSKRIVEKEVKIGNRKNERTDARTDP